MKIGIGITTYHRPEIFAESYEQWCKYLPAGAELTVVQDVTGIAKAKNRCLELLDDCDHIFLADDDVYPLVDNWWKPYVESGENHLMYQFKLPGKSATDMRVLHKDRNLVSYSHTRGALIYVTKQVLEVVGGLDTTYGLYGFEHTDWTNRIHNAGLTKYRAADVVGSDKLLYCLDQDKKVRSSIPEYEKKRSMKTNHMLYQLSKTSKAYKEYK